MYECAFRRHRTHRTFPDTSGVLRPRISMRSPATHPLAVTDAGTSNRCSRAATAHHGDRRQEGAGYQAVACVTTHRMPQLALAHTHSQMFRYRCVTAGSIWAMKNPYSPVEHWAVGGFSWRYRWDLNPRWSLPHTTFRESHLRPLGHGTAVDPSRDWGTTRIGEHAADTRMPRSSLSGCANQPRASAR